MTPEIIEKAWTASGLKPLNPQVVLDLLAKSEENRPVTPVTLDISPSLTTATPAHAPDIIQLIAHIRAAVPDIPLDLKIKLRKAEKGACKGQPISARLYEASQR